MEGLILSFSELTLLLCIAAIFALLFVTILKVLKEISFFQGTTAVIVALCVSLLSIIGMSTLIAGGDGLQEVNGNGGRNSGTLDFILLLYAVLGIAILLLLLIRCTAKIFRSDRDKRYFDETKRRRTERQYPFENASKAHEESNEESRIRR